MAKVTKYLKVDKNILLEYVYDDSNNISEAYDVLINTRNQQNSYIATDSSSTGNTIGNQLFKLDAVSNRYGKIDTSYYSFLQVKNYGISAPTIHDTLRVHLPVNWTFGEYLGFYVRVFSYDTENQRTYDLSNFYFDMTDISQQYLMNFTSPPLLFQEKLWGKNITVEIPSLNSVSNQRVDNRPKENSLNAILTDGNGFNINTPIFIDFHFIQSAQTINGVTTYLLSPKVATSLPQTPEYESLGLMIQRSPNGDFFEIFGTYNDTISGFKQFIDDSFFIGNRFYVQYNITMYEQNIRGKTLTTIVTDTFNEPIEYRPIIKYSTTTAIIDVEMRLIDAVDDSYIIRRASYGMLQDEVAKYALKLIKINLDKASKPKIYNIKNAIDPSLVGLSNSMGSLKLKQRPPMPAQQISASSAGSILGTSTNISEVSQTLNQLSTSPINTGGLISNAPSNVSSVGGTNNNNNNTTPTSSNVVIETIQVPFPVLVDRYEIIAKSENALFNSKTFFGMGKIQILLYPFDNVVRFSIASGLSTSPTYFDLSRFDQIRLTFKNDKTEVSFSLYVEAGVVDLKGGQCVFKVTQNKFQDIKKIYDSGVNIFYITGTSKSSTSVIYTGLFKIFDNKINVSELNKQAASENKKIPQDTLSKQIILDDTVSSQTTTVKPPISKETAPIKKPTGLKDFNDKIKNKFKK
jgi:hypothetical protein